MSRLVPLFLVCLSAVVCAQNTLDQSAPLNAERMGIAGDFNKAQSQLRAAKVEADRQAVYDRLVGLSERADSLRRKVVKGNVDVIDALNGLRGGTQSRSATIKAVTGKLTSANQALMAMPLPSGPQFNPGEVNQLQRVLDACKTTLDLHKHACQNLPK